MEYFNKDSYTGMWKDDMMEQLGEYTFENGNINIDLYFLEASILAYCFNAASKAIKINFNFNVSSFIYWGKIPYSWKILT